METIIDATDAVLGRLSAKVAKKLLEGEKIIIVNAEKAVISGKPKMVLKRFQEKREKTHLKKGPFFHKYPDKLIRRAIRGMLPYKKDKGRKAFKNLRVFIGQPKKYEKAEKIGKSMNDLECKFIKVGDICEKLGAKKRW